MNKKVKICSGCKTKKLFSRFGKDNSTKDGLDYWCKDCVKKYNKSYCEKVEKYCINCNKRLSRLSSIRCRKCNYKNRIKPKKLKYCVDCLKIISKNAKRCNSCSSKIKTCGIKNGRYINGQSKDPYTLAFNDSLKESIRQRDNHICQNPECNCTQKQNGQKLDVHHIDYDKQNIKENNLISLCRSCHCKTNSNRDYWYAYFTYKMENIKCS